jgi:hypothetical protein
VQVAELQRVIKFPTFEPVESRSSWAEAKQKDDLRVSERMRNLGVVLERLWRFYEAMHSGKPLRNSALVLPQMATALKGAMKPGGSV